MTNGWSKQSYVHYFYCELFFKAVNIFESMEIAETTYEGVIEYSYKNH